MGDQVAEGQTLLYIVPLDYIWVNANYKETQLRNVRMGQSVTFTADLYGGGVKYHGKVVGFQPGTGNAFAILPLKMLLEIGLKISSVFPCR